MSLAPSRKEIILEELVKILSEITELNGFNNDIKKVYDELQPIGDLNSFPCIVIEENREHYKTSDSAGHTVGLLEKKFPVILHCFMYNTKEKIHLQQKKMLTDVEFILCRDRKGTTINGSCQEAVFVDNDPFGTIVDKPNCGISIYLDIHYKQKRIDPTQKG